MREIDRINRLTPFEEYMFWDESPAFPMYSWQKLRFSGKLDFQILRESFAAAAARNPLMNARIVRRSGKLFWEFLDTPLDILQADSNTPDSELPSPDIRETAGTRTFCRYLEREDGTPETEVGLMVHHSVADGGGCQAIMEELMLGYAERKGTVLSSDAYPVISENSMALRHDPEVTWKRYLRLLSHGTKTTRNLVLRQPEGLLPLRRVDRKTPPIHSYLYKCFTLEPDEAAVYRKIAKKAGVTMNDLIMRDSFLAIAEFKRKYAPQSNKWIRMAMPMNMRTPNCPPLFAANVVSMVFLDRRPSQISESDEFLQKIHQETEWVKRTDQGLALLENLKGRRNLPGGIQMEVRGNRCWSTTVVSNLGVIFKNVKLPRTEDGRLIVGDTVLEEFIGVPPVRAKTFTGWGIWSYAGKLSMAMRYDERYLTGEQKDFIFDACKNRVCNAVRSS